MERACIFLEESEIDIMIDLLREFIHIPEVTLVHTKLRAARLPEVVHKAEKIDRMEKLALLLERFCQATGIDQEELKCQTRTRKLSDARFAFVNIALTKYNASERELAIFLNKDHSAINLYKKGMQCPQKREVYLKMKELLDKQTHANSVFTSHKA